MNKIVLFISALLLTSAANAQTVIDVQASRTDKGSKVEFVQDTFFNMTFGSKISLQNVKNNVGQRGSFYDEMDFGHYKVFSCLEITFGGEEWDSAEFLANGSGLFYSFSINKSISYNEDAPSFYSYLVERMNNKYKVSSPIDSYSDKDYKYSVYEGANGVNAVVVYEKSGYSPTVSLQYYHRALNQGVARERDEEL